LKLIFTAMLTLTAVWLLFMPNMLAGNHEDKND
jgi:hypothetical protein